MQYTQQQLLELAGMSFERLRHWRKEMPELEAKAGRGAHYTFEEIAVLAVLSRAVEDFKIATSVFAPHLSDLFAAFADNDHVGDEGTVLWVTPLTVVVGAIEAVPDSDTVAMVRIDRVLAGMMAKLNPSEPPQFMLPL